MTSRQWRSTWWAVPSRVSTRVRRLSLLSTPSPTRAPVPYRSTTVSSSVDNNGTDVEDPGLSAVTGCPSAWYQINGSAQTLDQSVPPGTTLFTTNSATATVLSIQMLNVNTSQDACEGADIGLSFSSN